MEEIIRNNITFIKGVLILGGLVALASIIYSSVKYFQIQRTKYSEITFGTVSEVNEIPCPTTNTQNCPKYSIKIKYLNNLEKVLETGQMYTQNSSITVYYNPNDKTDISLESDPTQNMYSSVYLWTIVVSCVGLAFSIGLYIYVNKIFKHALQIVQQINTGQELDPNQRQYVRINLGGRRGHRSPQFFN